LPNQSKARILNKYKTYLAKLSLTIEQFGENSIVILEIPNLINNINISNLILDLSNYLNRDEIKIMLDHKIVQQHIIRIYALHHRIAASKMMNINEMNLLLREIENTSILSNEKFSFGYYRRPTYIKLKLEYIEQIFNKQL